MASVALSIGLIFGISKGVAMNVLRSVDGENDIEGVDSATFRSVLGKFVTGVTVITAIDADATKRVGVTVSSFNTLSLDPPLILWSLALSAPSLPVFRTTDRFAVNILAHDQGGIATQFAKPHPDKFRGITTAHGLGSVPLIVEAAAHLECRVEQRHPGGDHELIIGRVLRAAGSHRIPLAYGHGQFGNFSIPSKEEAQS
jgi:flavin reductase (DIM6/NTAB) family NADH-FMN oxidoreductase RutF